MANREEGKIAKASGSPPLNSDSPPLKENAFSERQPDNTDSPASSPLKENASNINSAKEHSILPERQDNTTAGQANGIKEKVEKHEIEGTLTVVPNGEILPGVQAPVIDNLLNKDVTKTSPDNAEGKQQTDPEQRNNQTSDDFQNKEEIRYDGTEKDSDPAESEHYAGCPTSPQVATKPPTPLTPGDLDQKGAVDNFLRPLSAFGTSVIVAHSASSVKNGARPKVVPKPSPDSSPTRGRNKQTKRGTSGQNATGDDPRAKKRNQGDVGPTAFQTGDDSSGKAVRSSCPNRGQAMPAANTRTSTTSTTNSLERGDPDGGEKPVATATRSAEMPPVIKSVDTEGLDKRAETNQGDSRAQNAGMDNSNADSHPHDNRPKSCEELPDTSVLADHGTDGSRRLHAVVAAAFAASTGSMLSESSSQNKCESSTPNGHDGNLPTSASSLSVANSPSSSSSSPTPREREMTRTRRRSTSAASSHPSCPPRVLYPRLGIRLSASKYTLFDPDHTLDEDPFHGTRDDPPTAARPFTTDELGPHVHFPRPMQVRAQDVPHYIDVDLDPQRQLWGASDIHNHHSGQNQETGQTAQAEGHQTPPSQELLHHVLHHCGLDQEHGASGHDHSCQLCHRNRANVRLFNCHHVVICSSCAPSCVRCPRCGQIILAYYRFPDP